MNMTVFDLNSLVISGHRCSAIRPTETAHKHRQDKDLDCPEHLRAGSDSEEGTENRAKCGRNPPNPEHYTF